MSAATLLDQTPGQAARVPGSRARVLARPEYVALAALTVLAAVLRFGRIGHQGFWFDEGNTALLVHFAPGKMLGLIPQSESTPPLYYCVAWVWARVFGYTEAPLRSLSALAGVATVPVAFAAGRKLFSGRVGLVAAALVACNPLLIWYSQEARSYALLVLLTSVALLAFLRAREDPTPLRLGAWVLASALALATHYYAILAIVPQGLWLLAGHRRERRALLALGGVGVCGLALIPLALSQQATGHGDWIATVGLGRRLGEVVPQFLTGFELPARGVLLPLAAVLAAAGVVLAFVRGDERARRAALGAAGLVAGGLALDLVMVAVGVDDLITRNLLAVWLPAALVVAAGFGARRAGPLGLAAAAALCAIGVTAAIGVATNRDYQRPDWRGVARLLGSRPTPGVGERAIFVQHYRDLLPLSLYLPGLRFIRHRATAEVRELDIVTFTSPPSSGFCWWGSACNLWPSTAQSTYPVPGFTEVSRRRVYQFTVIRLVAARRVRLGGRAMARALTTTNYRNDELLAQR